jgi:hypothetical protein
MPYPGEKSNPLGLKGFLDDLELDHYEELLDELEELYREVKEARRIPLDEVDEVGESYPLLTLTVDGGEGLAFEELPLLSFGLVRVAAVGVNGFRLPPISHPLPGYAVLKDPPKYLEDLLARSGESEASYALNTFFQATGISLEDLGEHYAKDLKAFLGIFRDLLEWAYLVWTVEKVLGDDYRKYLFVKDGRLAQTGVKDEFRTKLREYFRRKDLLLVGVSKRSRLLAEGLTSLVMAKLFAEVRGTFLLQVPEALMEKAYRYERQWDADFQGAFVMGTRYVARLFESTFRPREGIAILDLPPHLKEEDAIRVAKSLKSHRSVLYKGSLGPIVEAHGKASVAKLLATRMEDEVLSRLRKSFGEEFARKIAEWLRLAEREVGRG